MRYYVVFVQQTPSGENREVPKAYDSLNDAVTEFHVHLGKDGKNANVIESVCMVFDSEGAVYRSEKTTGKATVTTTTEQTE